MISDINDISFDEFQMSFCKENKVEVYTDGSCIGNPGPGGWGVVFVIKNKRASISGFEKNTTNNKMELTAAIMALKSIPKKVPVTIYTDSSYVKTGITVWIKNWLKNNWISSTGKPVKNQDLWQELYKETLERDSLEWVWVKGHSDCSDNNNADFLARSAIVSSYMIDQ